jgi:hypothetical protein
VDQQEVCPLPIQRTVVGAREVFANVFDSALDTGALLEQEPKQPKPLRLDPYADSDGLEVALDTFADPRWAAEAIQVSGEGGALWRSDSMGSEPRGGLAIGWLLRRARGPLDPQ